MNRLSLLLLFCVFQLCLSAERKSYPLWPDRVPGEPKAKAAHVVSKNAKGDVLRISEVTDPVMIEYLPEPELSNGAAVLICPGGGYNVLAVNKEGYEIAEWLNGLGYAAFVLEYRVPKKREGALQDAQRAMRMIRGNREQWGIDADKIGILGFSAGGNLSARLSVHHGDVLYSPVDDLDASSAKPDFTVLVYPAYLDQGPDRSITPEIVSENALPPIFICVAANDPHAPSSLAMGRYLLDKKIPYALHVFPEGKHGFGLRPGNPAAEAWPGLCADWLQDTVFGEE